MLLDCCVEIGIAMSSCCFECDGCASVLKGVVNGNNVRAMLDVRKDGHMWQLVNARASGDIEARDYVVGVSVVITRTMIRSTVANTVLHSA